jgi:osmotically-inducible protein OsmY
MPKPLIKLLLFAILLVVFIAGCASTPKSESAGEYFDDTIITTKVKALLVKDVSLKSFQINVETYKGIVQLSGFVDTAETRGKAVSIAGGVKGVKSVKNNIILR